MGVIQTSDVHKLDALSSAEYNNAIKNALPLTQYVYTLEMVHRDVYDLPPVFSFQSPEPLEEKLEKTYMERGFIPDGSTNIYLRFRKIDEKSSEVATAVCAGDSDFFCGTRALAFIQGKRIAKFLINEQYSGSYTKQGLISGWLDYLIEAGYDARYAELWFSSIYHRGDCYSDGGISPENHVRIGRQFPRWSGESEFEGIELHMPRPNRENANEIFAWFESLKKK